MLKEIYIDLISAYISQSSEQEILWAEIEGNHSQKNRHYHNLTHLENLYLQLEPVKASIENWEAVLFAIFYHDVIYKVKRKDNEEKSAEIAERRLKEMSASRELIEKVNTLIIATKSHSKHEDEDINYFTDADLSILGQDREVYTEYVKNIRKEYSIFPSFMYNKGRIKVLDHFLEMDRIYKSEYFYKLYEERAKENLRMEKKMLK